MILLRPSKAFNRLSRCLEYRRSVFIVKILYLGPDSGTCRQRRLALERLGHQPTSINPFGVLGGNRWLSSWSFHTGGLGLATAVQNHVLSQIQARRFDLCLVDGGELIAPALLRALKICAPVIVNINLDNPFVSRDGGRWRLFLQSLQLYDLFVTPRRSSARAAIKAGAKRVMKVGFAADEVAHRPSSPGDLNRLRTDVTFVGTWMPERGPFMAALIDRGVPLSLYGARWNKAREYPALRGCLINRPLNDADYASAIRGTKIALGLLSKGNEDLHTTRSLEIPAMGVLFCGERTADHMALYEENREAVFWEDADECAERCLKLLRNPARIVEIAEAGRRRALKNRAFNEPLLSRILTVAMQLEATQLGRNDLPLVEAWLAPGLSAEA